jgi:glycosyltransferase involved in cell wall biosynthesis
MKIGIDARGETGIGRYAEYLIRQLLEIDTTNEYVLFVNQLLYDKISVEGKRARKILVKAHYYSLAEQTVFLRQIMRERVDMMHFLHFNVPLLYRGRFLVTIHDLILSFFPGNQKGVKAMIKKPGYQLTLQRATKQAEHIIAVSQQTKNDLISVVGADERNITVIYEGVDSKIFFPIDDQKAIADYRKANHFPEQFLLYIGVWSTHKNLVGLIRAFGVLKKKYHIPHSLIITGKKDPRHPEVEQEIQKHHLGRDVILSGFIPDEDLNLLYNAADLFVFPSFYEGFGIPPLESLQAGTPVASSHASCMPEVLKDAAVFFDPRDPKDIAQKVSEILGNQELREEKLANAKQLLATYQWDRMAQETLEIYQSLPR